MAETPIIPRVDPPNHLRSAGSADASGPSPLVGEGGARRAVVGGRGGLRDRARELRRSQTDAEAALWDVLRAKRLAGWKWRRQLPINRYIVDFACPSARLIVEADGGQHAAPCDDARRDAWLASQGWRVLRFWNTDILGNPDGVAGAILAALAPSPSHAFGAGPSLSRKGRGTEGAAQLGFKVAIPRSSA